MARFFIAACFIAAFFAVQQAAAQAPIPGLFYSFDEADGDVINDLGNGHNGTLVSVGGVDGTGPTRVPGFIGAGAMSFDGNDDAVFVQDFQDFTLLHNYSIGFWMMANLGEEGSIIAKTNGDENREGCAKRGNNSNRQFGNKRMELRADGTVQLSTPGTGATTTTVVADGEWHFVVGTYEYNVPQEILDEAGEVIGSQLVDRAKIYVDGIDETTTSGESRTGFLRRYASGSPLKLGFGDTYQGEDAADPDGLEASVRKKSHYAGYLDEVFILPGALSEAQIVALQEGDPIDCAAANDTACASVSVTAPAGGVAGFATITATSTNTDGNPTWYIFNAERVEGYDDAQALTPDARGVALTRGPQLENSAEIFLPGDSTYNITVTVLDDIVADGPLCPAAADADDVCAADPLVVGSADFQGRKVSQFGGGVQYWYDSEDFDASFPPTDMPANDGRSFGDFREVQPSSNAFGQYVVPRGVNVNAVDNPDSFGDNCGLDYSFGQPGWGMTFSFDISHAGGEEGNYIFWYRHVNPQNLSDFHGLDNDPDNAPVFEQLLIPREDDPATPADEGGLYPSGRGPDNPINSNSNRVFERTIGPVYTWDNRVGGRDGHTKRLADGLNRQHLNHRQGGNMNFWDVWMWTDDPEYVPTDSDYITSTQLNRMKRGDCNSDGGTDLSDGVAMLNIAFLGAAAPICTDACDFNATGALDITTAVFFFNALFLGGAPIRAPLDCDFGQPLLGCADVTEGCPRTGDVLRPVDGV